MPITVAAVPSMLVAGAETGAGETVVALAMVPAAAVGVAAAAAVEAAISVVAVAVATAIGLGVDHREINLRRQPNRCHY